MKKPHIFLSCIVISGSVLAADANVDSDGVPIIDVHGTIVQVTDANAINFSKQWGLPIPSKRIIAIGDKQMSLHEFLLTYCQGKFQNETCVRGFKIESIDSSSGPKKNLPKGL